MRTIIKIVSAVLLSTTLSGAVMAAGEDVNDRDLATKLSGAVRLAEEAGLEEDMNSAVLKLMTLPRGWKFIIDGANASERIINQERPSMTWDDTFKKYTAGDLKGAFGIENNASGTAQTITLSPYTFECIMRMKGSAQDEELARVLSGLQYAFKPLLDAVGSATDCVIAGKALGVNVKSKEFNFDLKKPDLGIPHDFVMDFKHDTLAKFLASKMTYIQLCVLSLEVMKADSGYAPLKEIAADLVALEVKRTSLAGDFDMATILAEYDALFSKAEKFRVGPKNKDLHAIFNEFSGKVPTAKYEAMKARFVAQAAMCGAIIVAEEDGAAEASEFVSIAVYNTKRAELKAKVLQAYNRFRSSFTGRPIEEIGDHRYFCRWHMLRMLKEIKAKEIKRA